LIPGQVQLRPSLQLHPRVSFAQLQAKFVLALLTTYLRLRSFWGYMVPVLLVQLLFLLCALFNASCSLRWLRRARLVGYFLAVWATISAMAVPSIGASWGHLVLLLVGSLFAALLPIAAFLAVDHLLARTS
jgi:hypothetical protein